MKQTSLPEILRDIELGPGNAKLDAIGRIYLLTDISVDDVQPALDKVLKQSPDLSPLKFFAAANLARLGDTRNQLLGFLIPFLNATAFDHGDDLLSFPWLGDRSDWFPDEVRPLGYLCNSSTQLATLEALSHMRGSDRAAATLSQFLEGVREIPWRAFAIYAIAANGQSPNRSILEYYLEKYAGSLEGHAAYYGLEYFGTASLFEIAQAHRNKVTPETESGSIREVFINRGGQQYGPYPIDVVRTWLKSGQLQANDLGCYTGGSEWVRLSALPGIGTK